MAGVVRGSHEEEARKRERPVPVLASRTRFLFRFED
jgi:hypothetical protein